MTRLELAASTTPSSAYYKKAELIALPKKSVIISEYILCATLIKAGVECIEILGVEVILSDSQGISESLIMHNLTLTQELNGFFNVRVVNESQDVVVGRAGLLLWHYAVKTTFFQNFQWIFMPISFVHKGFLEISILLINASVISLVRCSGWTYFSMIFLWSSPDSIRSFIC